MRQALILAVAVGVAAAAGVFADRELGPNGSHRSRAKPVFLVSSSYVSRPDGAGWFRLRTGAWPDSPMWGAALFEDFAYEYNGTGTKRKTVPEAPVVMTTPEPVGPLSIVERSRSEFVLRSSRGWLFSLEFESNLEVPTFYPLGPRLDPSHLPALRRRGYAVPVTYGARHKRRAVVLIAYDEIQGPKFYGRLDGYALPKPVSQSERLTRPLLGPDHALYEIDVARRRLVRIAAPSADRRPWDALNALPYRGCSSWPGRRVRYEACPGSITSIAPDRSRKAVYRDPNCGRLCRTQSDWGLVAPAPDGRTLLAEEGIFTCGEEFATYFIPAAGGTRRPVVPLADFGSAEGIGWVNRNQALIATDGFADCDPNRSAIYLVDRRAPQAPTLIVDANGHDATLWGRS